MVKGVLVVGHGKQRFDFKLSGIIFFAFFQPKTGVVSKLFG